MRLPTSHAAHCCVLAMSSLSLALLLLAPYHPGPSVPLLPTLVPSSLTSPAAFLAAFGQQKKREDALPGWAFFQRGTSPDNLTVGKCSRFANLIWEGVCVRRAGGLDRIGAPPLSALACFPSPFCSFCTCHTWERATGPLEGLA